MAKTALLILALTPASALLVQPALTRAQLVKPKPVPVAGIADLKDSLVPVNTDKSLRNVFGYQCTGWGLGGLLFPVQMMTTLFAMSVTAADVALLRGMSVAHLVLGAKICSDTDASAAATGVLFFAGWTYFLNKALAAGVAGAYTVPIMVWNTLCALVASRRQGGLYKTLTTLDTDAVSSLLPRDQELSTRNLVGAQLLAWGVIGLVFQPFLFGPMLLGITGSTATAMMASGIGGLVNLLVGGRVFGGDEKAAGQAGFLIFGAWAVIGWLGKAAGVFTGKFGLTIAIWNALFAGYCLKKAL